MILIDNFLTCFKSIKCKLCFKCFIFIKQLIIFISLCIIYKIRWWWWHALSFHLKLLLLREIFLEKGLGYLRTSAEQVYQNNILLFKCLHDISFLYFGKYLPYSIILELKLKLLGQIIFARYLLSYQICRQLA